MFSLFLQISASVNTEWPIERHQCGAWIGEYDYDLSGLQTRAYEQIEATINYHHLRFVIKVCNGFSSLEIPHDFDDMFMYSFAVCDEDNEVCYPLASKYSLDYAPYDSNNFEKGIILSLITQPDEDEFIRQITANSWKVEYNVLCNSTQTSSKYPAEILLTEREGLNEITVNLQYRGGCPKNLQKTPTPTPSYTPQCDFDARDPTSQLQGISMHLQDMNGGPYGHMLQDTVNGTKYWIFYQPCERSLNPANSSDTRWGSVWLCDENMNGCDQLGLVDDHTVLELERNNLNRPVYNQIYSDSSRKTTVYWTCSDNVPDNQFIFKKANLTDNNYYLEMTLESQESCVKSLPPTNVTGKCTLDWKDYHFNATKLNGAENQGYSQEIVVQTEHGSTKSLLYFQPCGPIFCPTSANCDQFEDAYIWLCDEASVHNDTHYCDAYGLAEHEVSTAFLTAANPDAGVLMTYQGGDYLTARVTYECSKDMDEGQVHIANTATVKNNILYLTVQTKESCGDNDPATRFIPEWPKKGATPTPTPLIHPQPNLILNNDTHYIIVDLHDADQTVDDQDLIIASQGKIASIHHHYAPFQEFSCPTGYDCKEFSTGDKATGWMCWEDEEGKDVCFPHASIRNKMSMTTISDSLDDGVTITYNGAYHVDLQLNVICDPNAAADIPLNSAASYAQNMYGAMELSFTTTSSLVCPQAYNQPTTPKARPTATPDPAIIENVLWDDDFDENGHMVELDLRRVPSRVVADVSLGRSTSSFESDTILWSPIDRVTCLDNYDCQGFSPANVWKCFVNSTNQRQCYPIGNAEYGLTLELAPNAYGYWADVVATYKGGLGNAKTNFLFVCNYSVPSDQVWIDPVGEQTYTSSQHISIYVHSSNVCFNRHVNDDYNSTTGGAIFLAIVFFGSIAYIVCGSLITFFVTGSVHVPQQAFWTEFGICIATGFMFIFTCGKRSSVGPANYDAI